MVFQGTIIPAIGMLIMPWHIDLTSAAGWPVSLALGGAFWLWLLHTTGRLKSGLLVLNALLYFTFGIYIAISFS